jgi:MFS family permease
MSLWWQAYSRFAVMRGRRYLQFVSHRTTILVLALLSQAATSLVQFGLPALFFALRDEYGMGPARFGLVFAAIGIGSGLMLAVAGRLCDRIGARPVLAAGTVIGALGLLTAGFAPNVAVLGVGLFIAGVGGSAVPVAGMTTLLKVFPPEQRGMVMGLRQMAVPAGGVIAAGLLPLLAHVGGLRLAFGVPAILVLVTGLSFAAVSGPAEGGRAPGGAGWSLPPGLPRLLLVGGLYVSGLGAVLAFTAAASEDAGLSTTEAGIVLAVLNIGAGVARVVWGRIADRERGTRRVRTLIDVGLVGTVAALAFPLLVHGGPVVAAASALALAFGVLGFNGIVYLIAGELGGPQRAGAAVGLASTVVFSVGAIVGPAYGVLAEQAGYTTMYLVVAGCMLAGAAVARGLAVPVREAHAVAA